LLKNLQPLTAQGILSAVMSQSIVWYKFTDASEGPIASILKVDGGSSYCTSYTALLSDTASHYNSHCCKNFKWHTM